MFNHAAALEEESRPTGIVRKDSIEELCAHRARALELYAQIPALLAEAQAAHARACIGQSYINPPDPADLKYRADDFVKRARKNIDRDMWRAFIVNTPLGALMDVDEHKKFDESLNDPPEITVETVFANLDRLRGDAAIIFRRGLVNAFSRLSRDYRSHDGFKIGSRMVLEYVARVWANNGKIWSVNLYSGAEERLRDIDRVMHILDGQPAPEYQQGLCAAIRTAMQDGTNGRDWQVETPYFRCRWFKNGNAHLWFLRDDLVRQANLMIAEHYGQTVGAAPDVAGKSPVPDQPPAPATDDFFETPPEIVERMLAHAGIAPDQNVLEPSAGLGAIARGFAETVGGRFTGYEASPERCRALEQEFPHAQIRQADFLRSTPLAGYDRILMNPPFSNGVDALHVIHALKFLAPGGRLVAVMSAGVTFRTTRGALHLKEIIAARGGIIEELQPGSFKASGTNVNTVLVVIDNT